VNGSRKKTCGRIRQTLRTKTLLPFARYQPQADPPVADAGTSAFAKPLRRDKQNGNYRGNRLMTSPKIYAQLFQ
jgi:hypothetical protein